MSDEYSQKTGDRHPSFYFFSLAQAKTDFPHIIQWVRFNSVRRVLIWVVVSEASVVVEAVTASS